MSRKRVQTVAPGVEVLLGGQALDPALRARLVEVRVQDSLMLPDSFLIRLSDPDLAEIDSDTFNIGVEVDIRFAAQHGTMRSICKGQVAALEPEFSAAGSFMAVRGYDYSHVLFRHRRTQSYQNSTADEIAKKVAARARLDTGTIDPSGPAYEFVQQSNENDWEFLWRLAAAIGFEVLVLDRKLHFRNAGAAAGQGTGNQGAGGGGPVELAWGSQLISFRPRATGIQQVDSVVVRGWDPASKQPLEASATPGTPSSTVGIEREPSVQPLGGGELTVADRPVLSQSEADALAGSVASLLGNAFVEAEGSCAGDPRLRAGAQVEISGVGDRFAGTYTLSSTAHVFRAVTGYVTQFVVSGRASRGLVDLMTPAAPRPWGQAVVVGVVTQNQDPEELGRVRVKYPALGDDTEGWWARVAAPSAGDGRGLLMMPVVGEEVLIAFEHGDVRRPYVLGSLFNGQEKPQSLAQANGSFALHSDHAVSVGAAEGVTIESAKDMQITSQADMTLSTQQGFSEQVQGNHSLNADGSVTIAAGASVTIESQAELTVTAPSITLQADGVVQISGSSVMLG